MPDVLAGLTMIASAWLALAGGNDPAALVKFTSRNTGMLVSRLVTLLDEISHQGSLNELSAIISQDEWEGFSLLRCPPVGGKEES